MSINSLFLRFFQRKIQNGAFHGHAIQQNDRADFYRQKNSGTRGEHFTDQNNVKNNKKVYLE